MSWKTPDEIMRQAMEADALRKRIGQANIDKYLTQHEAIQRIVEQTKASVLAHNEIAKAIEGVRNRALIDSDAFKGIMFSAFDRQTSKAMVDLFSGFSGILNRANDSIKHVYFSPHQSNRFTEIRRNVVDIFHLYQSKSMAASIAILTDFVSKNQLDLMAKSIAGAETFDFSKLGGSVGSAAFAALDFSSFNNELKQIVDLHSSFAGQVAETFRAAIEERNSSEETTRSLAELVQNKIDTLPNNRVAAEGLANLLLQVLSIIITLAILAQQSKGSSKATTLPVQQFSQLINITEHLAGSAGKLFPEEDLNTYYVVERSVQVRLKPQTRAAIAAILFPNQPVRLEKKKHQWIYVEYFDYIKGTPKYGWAYKKYLKRVTSNLRRYLQFKTKQYLPKDSSDHLTPQDQIAIKHNWEQTNARRVELIKKKINKQITSDEGEELDNLQRLADARIRLIAPLPIQPLESVLEDIKRRGM